MINRQVKETREVTEEPLKEFFKELIAQVSGNHLVSLQIQQKVGREIKGMFCLGKNNHRLSTD